MINIISKNNSKKCFLSTKLAYYKLKLKDQNTWTGIMAAENFTSFLLGMRRYTYLPIQYYHDTWVPKRYVWAPKNIFFFFKNLDSTSIAIQCCNV